MRKASVQVRATMSRRRNFVNYAKMTLADGTVLNLEPKDFRINGNEFTDDLVDGDNFQVGTTIGKTITLRLDNSDDRFSTYDFYLAYFYLYVHLPDAYTDDSGNLQDGIFNIGKFTVIEPTTSGTIIEMSGVDEMYKFDKSFDDCNLDFSTQPTLYTVLTKCCNDCGIAIGFTSFDNSTLRVTERPSGVTYREVVNYVCQIAGANAKISETGALKLLWYDMTVFGDNLDGGTFDYPGSTEYEDGDVADGGSFNPWNVGYIYDGGGFESTDDYHDLFNVKNLTVSTDDIEFTGVRVVYEDLSILVGTSNYVLELSDNPFTAGQERNIATFLFNKIQDLKFRPFSCSHLQDPTIESGDPALLWDRKGNVYKTIITNVTFTTGSYMSLACNAKNPTKQNSVYQNPSAQAVVEARRNTTKQIDSYKETINHFTELANEALGYYKTEVVESGATVTYLHDKSTLASSTNIVKINSAGIFISEDGGASYASGYDVTTATAVLNLVYAHGIVADWVESGIFRDKAGNFVLDLDNSTLKLALGTKVGDSRTLNSIVSSITANSNSILAEVTRAQNAEKELNSNYSGDYVPTLTNSPASAWTTNDLKNKHLGDIFIDNTTGDTYMFTNVRYGVAIKFVADSETESMNYDYLRVYYRDTSTGAYRYTENLGGKDSNNNLANRVIIIPTNSFYVYWRTDGSVNGFYGFDIEYCKLVESTDNEIEALFPNSTSTLPTSATNTLSGIAVFPKTEHPYTVNNEVKMWLWNTQISVPSSSGYSWVKKTEFKELKASIDILDQSISSKVSAEDYNGNTIASLINQTATTIKLQASKINLDGYVTLTNLKTAGATTINGSNITTGSISANRINGGTLSLGGFSNQSGILQMKNSSGVIFGTWNNSGLSLGSNFSVDAYGNLSCTNASIKGTVNIGYSNNTYGVLNIYGPSSSYSPIFKLDNDGLTAYSYNYNNSCSYVTKYARSGTLDESAAKVLKSTYYANLIAYYLSGYSAPFAYIGIRGNAAQYQSLVMYNKQSTILINANNSISLNASVDNDYYNGSYTYDREAAIYVQASNSNGGASNRARVTFQFSNTRYRTSTGALTYYSGSSYIDRQGFHGDGYGTWHGSFDPDEEGVEGKDAYNIRVRVYSGGDWIAGYYRMTFKKGILTDFYVE